MSRYSWCRIPKPDLSCMNEGATLNRQKSAIQATAPQTICSTAHQGRLCADGDLCKAAIVEPGAGSNRPRAAFHPPRRCRAEASPNRPFILGVAFSKGEGPLIGPSRHSLHMLDLRCISEGDLKDG